MDIALINERVDKCLRDNRRAETIVTSMAVGIFLLGLATLILAYWRQNPYIGGGSVLMEGFLYWPIAGILKLRRDNLILQILPVMAAQLPPRDAVDEIKKMLKHLRGEA